MAGYRALVVAFIKAGIFVSFAVSSSPPDYQRPPIPFHGGDFQTNSGDLGCIAIHRKSPPPIIGDTLI